MDTILKQVFIKNDAPPKRLWSTDSYYLSLSQTALVSPKEEPKENTILLLSKEGFRCEHNSKEYIFTDIDNEEVYRVAIRGSVASKEVLESIIGSVLMKDSFMGSVLMKDSFMGSVLMKDSFIMGQHNLSSCER